MDDYVATKAAVLQMSEFLFHKRKIDFLLAQTIVRLFNHMDLM